MSLRTHATSDAWTNNFVAPPIASARIALLEMSDDSDSDLPDLLPALEPYTPDVGFMLPDVAFALLHANGELAGTEATPNSVLDDGFARSLLSLSRSQALALRATLSTFDVGVARKLSTIEFSELLAAHGPVAAQARPGFMHYVSAAFGTLALVIPTKRDKELVEVAPALAVLLAAPTERVAASFAETLVHSEPAATLLNGELVTEMLATIYRELSPMFMLLLGTNLEPSQSIIPTWNSCDNRGIGAAGLSEAELAELRSSRRVASVGHRRRNRALN